MTVLKKKIFELRQKHDVMWKLIEQDYLLSWMLAGIASVPQLRDLLIFKGGTALKKAYCRIAHSFDNEDSIKITQDLNKLNCCITIA